MLSFFSLPEVNKQNALSTPKTVAMTFALDLSSFALTGPLPPLVATTLFVLCLQNCTDKPTFRHLLQFFEEMLQDLDSTC